MPIFADFPLVKYEDGTLVIGMSPPTPIGGWNIRFLLQHRFGGISGLLTAWTDSGYNGVSGITITNSGQGIFNIPLYSVILSGSDYGNYSFTAERMNSGFRTNLAEGYLLSNP